VDGDPATGAEDEDRTTLTTYTPDGGIATLTAVNPSTGNQVTRYVYGTTLADSDVARSDLLRAEIYPDSDDTADPLGNGPDGVYDRIEYKYNRQDERKEIKDQNGTVRTIDFDKLGRQTEDRVTTLGSGVDGAVRRIATIYEVRGLREKVTSYDNPTAGAGNVVNEVQAEYNDFAQLVTEYQAHAGAVNTASTPKVQYGYADGSANTVRPTSVTYPDGRQLDFDYGTAGGIDDAASRIQAVKDVTLALVQYAYLGQATFVEADYTEPDVKWTLIDLAGNNDPDTGDIYSGLDRFGRVKDNRWYDYGASTDADRIKYGYDRAGNRLWREVPLDPNDSHDELYAYDGLQRLDDFDRGALNAAKGKPCFHVEDSKLLDCKVTIKKKINCGFKGRFITPKAICDGIGKKVADKKTGLDVECPNGCECKNKEKQDGKTLTKTYKDLTLPLDEEVRKGCKVIIDITVKLKVGKGWIGECCKKEGK